MQHSTELNIMIQKRMGEIEAEIENTFPEFKEPDKPEDPLDTVEQIYSTSHFTGSNAKYLVYPMTRRDIYQAEQFSPREDNPKLEIREALKIAFEKYYSQTDLREKDFWENARITLQSYELESEDESAPESTYFWFYNVSVDGFFPYLNFVNPAPIVIKLDGTTIEPQEGESPF